MEKKIFAPAAVTVALAFGCGGAKKTPDLLQDMTLNDEVCDAHIRVLRNTAATLAWEKALGGILTRAGDPRWEKSIHQCLEKRPDRGEKLIKANEKMAELTRTSEAGKCKDLSGSSQDICLAKALTEAACARVVESSLQELITAESELYSCASYSGNRLGDENNELSVCTLGKNRHITSDADLEEIATGQEVTTNLMTRLAQRPIQTRIFDEGLMGCTPINIDPSSLKGWHPLQCERINHAGDVKPVSTLDFSQCYQPHPAQETHSEPEPASSPTLEPLDLNVGILRFDETMIRFETTDFLQNNGLEALNYCIDDAAKSLSPQAKEKFDTARLKAGKDYLFWLDQEFIKNVGEKDVAQFAEKYRACLKKK